MAIQNAKGLVNSGKDSVILLNLFNARSWS